MELQNGGDQEYMSGISAGKSIEMKIFMVTPFFPYSKVPYAGGMIVYELIKHLSKKYDIYLLSRIEPYELSHVDDIRPFCRTIELHEFKTPSHRSIIAQFLIVISYLRLAVKANRIIKKNAFDVIQIEFSETALGISRQQGTLFLLHAHDVLYKPALRRFRKTRNPVYRVLYFLIWHITMMTERYILKKFNRVFTKSDQDKAILREVYNFPGDIDVIPFHIMPEKVSVSGDIPRDPATLIFVGAMNRDVNIEAALFIYEKVIPLVRREIRDVRLCIIGNKPPEKLIQVSLNDPFLKVTGYVDSLLPYYQRATVFVAPLFVGGGIITKNIEAMANEVPVVTTAIGNEGIRAVPDRDLLMAETSEEFAQAILYLLKNPGKSREIGRRGREFAEKHFNQDAVFMKIDSIYENFCKAGQKAG
jgi:glycosyltransferase involved in cell wall biosynthesis